MRGTQKQVQEMTHLGHGIVDATKCVLTAQAFDTEDLDLHMRNSVNDYGIDA